MLTSGTIWVILILVYISNGDGMSANYRIEYLTDLDKYLSRITVSEQRKVGKQFRYLHEYGLRNEVLNTKKLKGYDFWEIRILGKNNTRIFCYQAKSTIYILHVFRKNSQKTKAKDLKIAQNMLKKIPLYKYIEKDIIKT